MSSLTNTTQNSELISKKIIFAHSFWERGRGLLGRETIDPDSVMWLKPCNNIHTMFMKFALDVVFVDRNLIVRSIHRNVKPWLPLLFSWGAHSAFEFLAGTLENKNINIGDQLHVSD